MARKDVEPESEASEEDPSSTWLLDIQLASSTKELVKEKIAFVDAKSPDRHYEELKRRYKPINAVKTNSNGPQTASQLQQERYRQCDGLPTPKIVLFSPDRVDTNWKTPKRIGAGLANLGNTCFLNSVLQCLTYTPPLINYMNSGDHKASCRVRGFCVLCELHQHVEEAHRRVGQTMQPLGIVSKLKNIAKHLRVGRQEDAHEFLRYLIDGLQRACLAGFSTGSLDRPSQETTAIHQIFGGYYRSQVICFKCRNKSDTYEPLLDLSLNIKDCITLRKALEKYIQPEILDGCNKYFCSKCKQKVKAQKRLTVHRPPHVLTIQFKRFEFSSMFGFKIGKEVKFEDTLDLRPFLSNRNGPKELYQLNAVLVHSGYSCNSGHYYCYVKSPAGYWFCMNDSQVRQVSQQSVLSQQAYLLFYCHVQPKSQSQQHSQNTPGRVPSAYNSRNRTPLPVPSSPAQKEATTKIVQPVKPRIISESPKPHLSVTKFVIKKPAKPSWEEALTGKKSQPAASVKPPDKPETAMVNQAEKSVPSFQQKPKEDEKSIAIFSSSKPTAVVPPSVTSLPPKPSLSKPISNLNCSQESVKERPLKEEKEKDKVVSSDGLKALKSYESPEGQRSPSPARVVPATSTTPGSPEKVKQDDGEEFYGPEEPSGAETLKKKRKREKKQKKHKKHKSRLRGSDSEGDGCKRRKSHSKSRGRSRSQEESAATSKSLSRSPSVERKRRKRKRRSSSRERERSRSRSIGHSADRKERTFRRSGSLDERGRRAEERTSSGWSRTGRSRSRSHSLERSDIKAEKARFKGGIAMATCHKRSVDSQDVLNQLTKSTGHGYGKSVRAWDGGPSKVNRLEESEPKRSKRDDWDDEYDKGRVNKVKSHHRKYTDMPRNAFQQVQNKWNRKQIRHHSDRDRRHHHRHGR
eukprot:m.23746 g.23746  ORF g.23746 m.23746 type:complete len:914 (+) comp28525_c0_seq1:105-2846(+)